MDYWKLIEVILGGIKYGFDYVFVNIVKLSFFENKNVIIWIIRFNKLCFREKGLCLD